MNTSDPNDYGVFLNTTIVEQHKDQYIEYNIRKSVFKNEEYFACSVTISAFGIYSGFSGPVSISCKSSKEAEANFIKTFIQRELSHSENGLKHISKLPLFQNSKQLSLFE